MCDFVLGCAENRKVNDIQNFHVICKQECSIVLGDAECS